MSFPECFKNNPLVDRADLQRLLVDLVNPLLPHFSPSGAGVRLGENRAHYGDPAGWLEGYARPLWGLAALHAGGGQWDHWQLWQKGLKNGTNPDHPDFWGMAGDYDQRSVEQAAFGFSLALAPAPFWNELDAGTQASLTRWLLRINEVQLVRSNWLYFRILVNLGLRLRGQPHDWARVEADFSLLETFYLGGGWYSDGSSAAPWRDGRTGDYYIPMAFHLYSLIYAKLAEHIDPARCEILKKRAGELALDFQYWFSRDGSALPYGRSLAYRFAQGAFWGGLAYANVEALPWPVIKGLFLRHIRWWMQQPIFSETGLLTIGYTYPNLAMAESYNSPGSPYWALKAFLPLALPESHPLWQADEAPLPARRPVKTISEASLILTTNSVGDVTAVSPGQPVLDWPRNAPHKYSKCAYSTRFGFSVPISVPIPTEGGFDNELSLSDDQRFYRRRDFAEDATVQDGVACSVWKPWPDVVVKSWLLAEPEGHIRIHHIKSGRRLWSMDAGFAAIWHRRSDIKTHASPFTICTPAGASLIQDLSGSRNTAQIDLGTNSHLLASLSSMPVLQAEHPGGDYWLATWVSGSARENAPPSEFRFHVSENSCHITRSGSPWWDNQGSPCGHSCAARMELIFHHNNPCI